MSIQHTHVTYECLMIEGLDPLCKIVLGENRLYPLWSREIQRVRDVARDDGVRDLRRAGSSKLLGERRRVATEGRRTLQKAQCRKIDINKRTDVLSHLGRPNKTSSSG